ncbi:MAG: 2-keto-4-pentenoate hydratase, partial [Mycobacterium sp.]
MLTAGTRDELAADLAQAERSRQPIAPLTTASPDIDVVDAYEIQLINIRQRVAEGARVVGHKVGLSSKVMQQMRGVDEPDYGHLLDDMQVFEDTPVKA